MIESTVAVHTKGLGFSFQADRKSLIGATRSATLKKRSMPDAFVGQLGKPAFNQIQPTTTCRNVVDDKTWMLRQPSFYGSMPMSSVVVHDQVQVLPPGKLVIKTTQESEKFLMAMTFVAVTDHLPLQQIQGSK